MHTIRAGEELKFGSMAKSLRLQTHSDSIRCEVDGTSKKYVATRSGYLHAESSMSNLHRSSKTESKQKKDKMQIDILPFHSNRYYPQENDTVIGVIMTKNPEFFTVDIGSDSYAFLNCLEFQNATRKEQPKYPDGTLIYCRVLSNDRFGRTQLSCINPLEKKAWNSGEAFFQSLKGGFVIDLPISFCRLQMLSAKQDYLLEQLGQHFAFDVCTGFNGKVWVKGERPVDTILITTSLQKVIEKVQHLESSGGLASVSNVYQHPEVKKVVDDICQSLKDGKK